MNIISVFHLFLLLCIVSVLASQAPDGWARRKIEELKTILGEPLNPDLSNFLNFLGDDENWRRLSGQKFISSLLQSGLVTDFNQVKEINYAGPSGKSPLCDEHFRLLEPFDQSVQPSTAIDFLSNLIPLLNHMKLAKKAPIGGSTSDADKNFIKNVNPLQFLTNLFNGFQCAIHQPDAGDLFEDKELLNELRAVIPPPKPPVKGKTSNPDLDTSPDGKSSNSPGQRPTNGWSTTKKAFVFGGIGLAVLVTIGLVLFFAFGKQPSAASPV